MDMLRRFDDKYLALSAGRRLDLIFDRATLTGLNFFAEAGGPVVIVACFEKGLTKQQAKVAGRAISLGDELHFELQEATFEEYLEQLSGGIIGFLGDGLPAFETWVRDGSLWPR